MPRISQILADAKERLDTLIGKARAHAYKPIGIAETLYRNRVERTVDLSQLSQYRRRSDKWCGEVCLELYGRRNVSNSRYWDQLFAVLPPDMLVALGDENCRNNGIVENYIYAHIVDKMNGVLGIAERVRECEPRDFDLLTFLAEFEGDPRFARSADKAYEIVVYALFNAITKHINATVTLSVDPKKAILADFEEFAKLVLGVDVAHPEIKQPARLYRVGTANAADAGIDMWANFGPAVQVKHLSLKPKDFDKIGEGLHADQIVIVCKRVEAPSIEAVLAQIGFRDRIRGVITEVDLTHWYALACGKKYHTTLGKDLLAAIRQEIALEFPLTDKEESKRVVGFMSRRGYDMSKTSGIWSIKQIPPATGDND